MITRFHVYQQIRLEVNEQLPFVLLAPPLGVILPPCPPPPADLGRLPDSDPPVPFLIGHSNTYRIGGAGDRSRVQQEADVEEARAAKHRVVCGRRDEEVRRRKNRGGSEGANVAVDEGEEGSHQIGQQKHVVVQLECRYCSGVTSSTESWVEKRTTRRPVKMASR